MTDEHGPPLVLVERRGRVGLLTINRPAVRNAVDVATTRAMASAIDELEADDEVWVLIVTGAGEQSFCAGADLRELAADPMAMRDEVIHPLGGFAAMTERILQKPTIAAVNGTALGGGTELCLACDLIIAEEHAQFGLPEVRRGLVAAGRGLERLPRRIAPVLAMELILTGLPLTAGRAEQLGLINRVVPRGSSVPAAMALAGQICEAAPLAVRYSRAVARASFSMGERDVAASEQELLDAVVASDDLNEGLRAFRELRDPTWRGR